MKRIEIEPWLFVKVGYRELARLFCRRSGFSKSEASSGCTAIRGVPVNADDGRLRFEKESPMTLYARTFELMRNFKVTFYRSSLFNVMAVS
jgi:hypothetical protein